MVHGCALVAHDWVVIMYHYGTFLYTWYSYVPIAGTSLGSSGTWKTRMWDIVISSVNWTLDPKKDFFSDKKKLFFDPKFNLLKKSRYTKTKWTKDLT